MIKKIIFHLYAHLIGLIKIFSFQKKVIEVKIKKPIHVKINNNDVKLHERLFDFYKKLKLDEINTPDLVKPSSMWQKHIDNDYKFLVKSYKQNNLDSFSFFLSNFGNWNNYLGIEHNNLLQRYSKNFLLKSFLKNEI